MLKKLSLALVACVGYLIAPQAAEAQRAPIQYAGSQPSASATSNNNLTGGDARSYGYGGTNTSQNDGAVLDLRRPADAPATAPVQSASSQGDANGQGRPAWLENERVGPPYQANGRWYVPAAEPGYEATGMASWYGPTFHGGRTASGETYDQEAITAAHPTLPIPSLVQVTNLENGREVIVRVNDRGPFVGDRILDLSHGAAQVLGVERNGTARVHIRYLGPAPRHYSDALAPVQNADAAPSSPPLRSASVEEGRPISLLPPHEEQSPAPAQTVQPVSYEPTAPAPLTGAGGFFVQVGAYSDIDNAHRVQAAVSSAGRANVDVRRNGVGTELFRVRIGPFGDRASADAARRSILNLGYPDSTVVAP